VKPLAGGLKLPSYVQSQNAPKPDLPAVIDGGQAGFFAYPKINPKTVLEPPGKGGQVSMMSWNIGPPLAPVDQNPALQQMNKDLGVTLNVSAVPQSDYNVRQPAVLAGDDLPDVMFISPITPVPQLADFLAAKCADLTDILGGDAVEEFPNLAAYPQFHWRGMAFNNRLYGVPAVSQRSLYNLWVHAELLDQTGGAMPQSADDFKRILTQISKDGNGNVFGMTAQLATAYQNFFGTQPAMFGAPNAWALDSSGKLTRTFETEAFKAAVNFTRELFAAGAYAPDANISDGAKTKGDFLSRRVAFYTDGFGSSVSQYWDAGTTLTPPGKLHITPPFAADGKSKPTYWFGPGNFGFVVLKKASADRLKEVLGVLNYFAAPFGSAEHLLINYGIKDVHYHLDDNGNPILTDQGKAQNSSFWSLVQRPPSVIFNPNSMEYATTLQADEKTELAAGIADPTVGFYSQTDGTKGGLLNKAFYDGVTDIVAGRRPFTDYDGLVNDWRTAGGNQTRTEYEAAIAASAG
jgi:putative aldouronate transport system substrate-binding protein